MKNPFIIVTAGKIKIRVNILSIHAYRPNDAPMPKAGENTIITYGNGHGYYIKESVEEIDQAINAYYGG